MKFRNIITTLEIVLPIRREMFEGREQLVAPVVALVEGVYNGLYYPAGEMAKYPDAWNGSSLPVFHPQDSGKNVSANTPKLIEARSVGRLFNVRYESDKSRLVGEIWVDVKKAESIAPEVLHLIRSGGQLEISTALFTDSDGTSGIWQEKEFVATLSNFRPDHLALLPGGRGACSWEDGCGVRSNLFLGLEVNGSMNKTKGALLKFLALTREVGSYLGFVSQESSHEELRAKLQRALDGLDNEGWIHFVREVYDDFVIYEARGNNPNEIGGIRAVSKLYRREFTIDENEEVTLADAATEVREERNYIPVGNADGTKVNQKLPPEESTMKKKDELIKALIECECNTLAEKDGEWLKTLEVDALEKLRIIKKPDPAPVVNEPKKPDPAPVVNEPKKADPPKAKDVPVKKVDEPVTLEAFIAAAPPEIAGVLNRAVARDKAAKDEIIKALLANARNKFTEEQLQKKEIDELQTLAELGNVEVDFSLQAGGPAVNLDDENAVPDMPPVFDFGKTKEKTSA